MVKLSKVSWTGQEYGAETMTPEAALAYQHKWGLKDVSRDGASFLYRGGSLVAVVRWAN